MSKKTAVLSWKYIASMALGTLLLAGCARRVPRSDDITYYVEPTTWIEPTIQPQGNNEAEMQPPSTSLYHAMDTLLQEQSHWRKAEGQLEGYSVQLYKGSSRQTAETLHHKARKILKHASTLSYQQPYYTLWVGFFSERLEAYSYLRHIERHFSQALVLPRRVPITTLLSEE